MLQLIFSVYNILEIKKSIVKVQSSKSTVHWHIFTQGDRFLRNIFFQKKFEQNRTLIGWVA